MPLWTCKSCLETTRCLDDILQVHYSFVDLMVNSKLKVTALIMLLCEMYTCFVLHGIQPAWSVDLIGVLVAGVSIP